MKTKGLTTGLGLTVGAVLLLAAGIPTLYAADSDFTNGIQVDSTLDAVDANVGDGICDDGAGNCTLRAAVQEANAHAGLDTIDLTAINDPNTPITLTINGADEGYAASTGTTPYAVTETHDAAIGDLNITDSTDIVGAGSALTIIEWSAASQTDGDPATGDRIFHVEAVTQNIEVTISGLTVRNGTTPPVVDIETNTDGTIWQFKRSGGGIAIGPAASVFLTDPNAAHGGGGGGGTDHGGPGGEEGETGFTVDSISITDVRVLANIAGGDGGGIYNAGPLMLEDSVLSGNSAANGGGIYNDAALTMVNTLIGTSAADPSFANPNDAENGGGMFDTGFHTTEIDSSAIVGNTATGGGGIAARSLVTLNIENSTISGNVAADVGGGITTNGTANLVNSTVANNSAPTDAEGGGAGINSFGSGTYTFLNTLVANNASTTGVKNCGCTGSSAACPPGRLISRGHNLEDIDTCDFSGTGDQINTDPLLEALADNGGPTETHGIPMTSPAIDTGDNTNCPNNDQRGSIRPADGNLDGTFVCDIGAFELFVHTADLHINNMTAPNRVHKGDEFTISVEMHNDPTATTTATAVVLTSDPLPAGFTLTSANMTVSSITSACSVASNVITCNIGDLAVDQAATVDIVGSTTTLGRNDFGVTISASAPIDPVPENNVASVHVAVYGDADMAIAASISGSSINVTEQKTLTATVTNNGPDGATNAEFGTDVPSTLTVVSATPSVGTCTVADDGGVLCNFGDLASGASASVALVLEGASEGDGSLILYTQADQLDTDATNDSASVPLAVIGLSDLSLSLNATPSLLSVGDTATISQSVTNGGDSDTTNVVVTTTVPSGLTVSGNLATGCTAASGTVTCTIATLAVGATAQLNFAVTGSTAGTYTISGTASSDRLDPDASNNTPTAGIVVRSGFSANGGGGGGGCVYTPDGSFDPMLPTLLLLGLIGLASRRIGTRRSR